MGRRKIPYYHKKRQLPKWTPLRSKMLIYNNIIRIYRAFSKKLPVYQTSKEWKNRRKLTIPSSLTKKAVECPINFIEYYHIVKCHTIGIAIEQICLSGISTCLKPGYQIFSKLYPYLSATPDAFTKAENLSIEIKSAIKGNVVDVIRNNYHQLQFTIFCCDSPLIIQFAYILTGKFYMVNVYRDQDFINSCLPNIEFTFYKYIFKFNDQFTFDDLFKFPINRKC